MTIKDIYQTLSSNGADVGTFEQFDSWFRDKDKGTSRRQQVYAALKEDGYNVGETYNDFAYSLFGKPKSATPPATQKQTQAKQAPAQKAPTQAKQTTPKQTTTPVTEASPTKQPGASTYLTFRIGGQNNLISSDELKSLGGLNGYMSALGKNGVDTNKVRVYLTKKGADGKWSKIHVPVSAVSEYLKKGYSYFGPSMTKEQAEITRQEHKLGDLQNKLSAVHKQYTDLLRARDKRVHSDNSILGLIGASASEANRTMHMTPTGHNAGATDTDEDRKAKALYASMVAYSEAIDKQKDLIAGLKGASTVEKVGRGILRGATSINTLTAGMANLSVKSEVDYAQKTIDAAKKDKSGRTKAFSEQNGLIAAANSMDEATQNANAVMGNWYGIPEMITKMGLDPKMYIGGFGAGAIAPKILNGIARFAVGKAGVGVAERIFVNTVVGKMASGSINSAINFGIYEGLSNAEQQLMTEWETGADGTVGKAKPTARKAMGVTGGILGAAGHGMILGGTMGVSGAVVGNVGDKLLSVSKGSVSKEIGSHLAKGTLGTLFNGTIFATDGWLRGEGFDLGHGIATDLGFKVSHSAKSLANAVKSSKPIKNPSTVEELNHNNRSFTERFTRAIRNDNQLAITRDERDELRRNGHGELEDLFRAPKKHTPSVIDPAKGAGTPDGRKRIDAYEAAQRVIEDTNVSEATRAKIYYFATGNYIPASPILYCNVEDVTDEYKHWDSGYDLDSSGKNMWKPTKRYRVSTLGAGGSIVTTKVVAESALKSHLSDIERQIELNTISLGELRIEEVGRKEAMMSAVSDLAKEYDVNVEQMANLMIQISTRKKQGKNVSDAENQILERYDEIISEKMKNRRTAKSIEEDITKEYLENGKGAVDLKSAIRTNKATRTEVEEDALAEYTMRLWEEDKPQSNTQEAESEQSFSQYEDVSTQKSEIETQTEEEYNTICNKDTGEVQRVEVYLDASKDTTPAYVVSGNVTPDRNGGVDLEKSDKDIYIHIEGEGLNKIIPISDIATCEEGVSKEVWISQRAAELQSSQPSPEVNATPSSESQAPTEEAPTSQTSEQTADPKLVELQDNLDKAYEELQNVWNERYEVFGDLAEDREAALQSDPDAFLERTDLTLEEREFAQRYSNAEFNFMHAQGALENYQRQEASKANDEESSTVERPDAVENSVESTDAPIDANELEPNAETPDIPIYMPESERPIERTQDEMRESDTVESSEAEDGKFGQRYEMTEAENPSEPMSYPDEYTGWGVHLSSDEIESNISKFDRRSSEELEQELEDLAYDLRVHMEDDFIDRDFVEETSREIAEIDAELKRRKAEKRTQNEEARTNALTVEPSEKSTQSVETSRVPLDENGNPKFEEMPDHKEAWSAMVERYKGEDGAHTVATIMASKASKELEEVRKETPRLADMPTLNEADYAPDYSKASSPDEIFEIYEEVNRRKKADADRIAAVEEQNRALLKGYSDKVSAAEKKVEAWNNIAKQYGNNTSEVANTSTENHAVDTSKEIATAEKPKVAMDQTQPTDTPTQSDAVAHILDIARGGKSKPKPKTKPKAPKPKTQEVAVEPIGKEPEAKPEAKEQNPTAKVEAKNNAPKQSEDKAFKPTATSEDIKSRLAAILGGGSNDGLRFRDTGLSREEEKEVYRLGVDLAFEYFDQGITDFDAFANEMIGYVGDTIRPWVKSFYEGAKMTPRYDDIEFSTSDYVRSFDVSKIGVPAVDESAAELTPQVEEASKPTAEPKPTESANVESKPAKEEKVNPKANGKSAEEKPKMNGTDYTVGTHVSYRTDAGVMECEIEEVLPNGNFNLQGPSTLGIPTTHMNVPKEKLHIPGTDEAIEYHYNEMAKLIQKNRQVTKSEWESEQENLWSSIDKQKRQIEELSDRGIPFGRIENLSSMIGMYMCINDYLNGYELKYLKASDYVEHEMHGSKQKALGELLGLLGHKSESPTAEKPSKSQSKPSTPKTAESKSADVEVTEQKPSESDKDQKVEESKTPKLEGISETPDPKEQAFVADAIERLAGENRQPMGILEVEALAKKNGLDMRRKELQELVEWSINEMVRPNAEMACKLGFSSEEAKALYDKAVALYYRQPSLVASDSTRKELQQFSTPIPMTFAANMFLTHGREVKQAFEPTAGNGAGFIGIPYRLCHMNEIDPRRVQNLVNQGYKNVTMQNALSQFKSWCDTIFANPPFGKLPEKVSYDGGIFKIGGLENVMSINALNTMSDNGRAVLVIGGHLGANPTPYAENGRLKSLEDRQFFSYLYSHYNVVDIIPIDGKALYSRNGTGYPVRMILIDGRRRDANGNVIREVTEENRVYAPVLNKVNNETVKTYDELYERIKQNALSLSERVYRGEHDSTPVARREGDKESDIENNPASDRDGGRPVGGREHGGTVKDGMGESRVGSGRTGESEQAGSKESGVRNSEYNPSSESGRSSARGNNRGGSSTERRGGGNSAGVDAVSQKSERVRRLSEEEEAKIDKDVEVEAGVENVESPRMSRSMSLNTRMPAQQAVAYQNALRRHRDKHGDIDEYVADKLGYSSTDEMFEHLSSEQIEGVGLAIDRIDEGGGFIIGDQTGIGKGRQAASIIRYAAKQGKVPIFFTLKPALYSDMHRDLCDIGTDNLRPFIFASKDEGNISIADENGNMKTVHKLPSPKEQERVFSYIEKHGKLPPEYDFVMVTYSQVQTGTVDYEVNSKGEIVEKPKTGKNGVESKGVASAGRNGQRRRALIEKLAQGNIVILDEAHQAGGQSNTGLYMQKMLPATQGVVYLSATYAKRPENMPVYALKTSIKGEGISQEELIEAVKSGGLPIQELMSQRLVEAGEMIRRERDFRGMRINYKDPSPEIKTYQLSKFDGVADIFCEIRDFQNTYVRKVIKDISADLAEVGGMADAKQGTSNLGVDNPPFASKTYNLVNQALFALKTDQTVDLIENAIKNGEHPGICFTNTMEGYIEDLDVPKGGFTEMPTMAAALRSALNGVLRYTITDGDEEQSHDWIKLSQLPGDGEYEFYRIMDKIGQIAEGLPLSPIDDIIIKLEDKGYSVREVTGRKKRIAKNADGRYEVVNVEHTDKKQNVHDWNQGKVDVILFNSAGSTGLSMHSNPKFANHDPRHGIFAQVSSDIVTLMQSLGRFDRSGQVHRANITMITSSIPAEQRLLMMTKSKLKSLNANTTSAQDASYSDVDVEDVLNFYGDEVVYKYMLDNIGLNEELDNPLKLEFNKNSGEFVVPDNAADKEAPADLARKVLGRLPFLTTARQESVLNDISEAYTALIKEVDERGENMLTIRDTDLKATTKSKKVYAQGSNPGSGNPFTDNVYVEECETNILDKPMSHSQVNGLHRQMLENAGYENWEDFVVGERGKIEQLYNARIEEAERKIREKGEIQIENARQSEKRALESARQRGRNEYTDEEIDKLANESADNKAAEIDEKVLKERNRLQFGKNKMLKALSDDKVPMKGLSIPNKLEEKGEYDHEFRPGVLIGIKFDKNYTAKGSKYVFATLDGRRIVRASVDNTMMVFEKITSSSRRCNYALSRFDIGQWDRYIPAETRETRLILTGNVMKGLISLKSTKTPGQTIRYTTDSGEVKTGILLPRSAKINNLKENVPIHEAENILLNKGEIESSDKKVKINRCSYPRNRYELYVPASVRNGGKFFTDEVLKSLTNERLFDMPTKKTAKATFERDRLPDVLKRLSELGVTVNRVAELKEVESEIARTPESTPNETIPFKDGKNALLDIDKGELVSSDGDVKVSLMGEMKDGRYKYYYTLSVNPGQRGERIRTNKTLCDFFKDKEIPYRTGDRWATARFESEQLDDVLNTLSDLGVTANPEDKTEPKGKFRESDTGIASIEPSSNTPDLIVNAAQKTAQSLGNGVTVLSSPTELKGLSERQKRAKGWYDEKTGKIFVIAGNHTSVADIENTISHEVVGHKGLRKLLGKAFDSFLDFVWRNTASSVKKGMEKIFERENAKLVTNLMNQESIKKAYEAYVKEHGALPGGIRTFAHTEANKHRSRLQKLAVEEYMSDLAGKIKNEGFEKMSAEEKTLWGKIKSRIVEMINNFLKGKGFKNTFKINDKDLAYVLYQSWKGLKGEKTLFDKAEDIVMRRGTSYEKEFEKDDKPEPEDPTDGPDGGVRYREKTISEIIQETQQKVLEAAEGDLQNKHNAVRSIGSNLAQMNRAMSQQRHYDYQTVKAIAELAQDFMKTGLLDGMSKYEMNRVLANVKNVVGKKDISKNVATMMDIMISNLLGNVSRRFGRMVATRPTKVDSRGVEVQASLDTDGQTIVKTLKKGINLSMDEVTQGMADALNEMGDSDPVVSGNAALVYEGLKMAQTYHDTIKVSKNEETELRADLKWAIDEHKAGRMSDDSYAQYVESTYDAIRDNKTERIEAYYDLIDSVGDVISESSQRAVAWRREQKNRVAEIQHNANSDMEGRPASAHIRTTALQKLANLGGLKFMFAPMATFDQMLRMFGQKNARGEGYLYNRFMNQWVESTEKEYEGYRSAVAKLDEIASAAGVKSWSDLFILDRKLGKIPVSFFDAGERVEFEITQGEALYIVLANGMTDGRMKLRAMGISEANVADIEAALDPRIMALADPMRQLLADLRGKYNEVHKRMFGANMANIANYFPLRILNNAIPEMVDVGVQQNPNDKPSTITGSVIKRTRNRLPLDIRNANALSVILEHINEMEKWAAFAEFNRDLNTLLSYKRFRNQIKNMASPVYGGGDALWKSFRDACTMAAGTYRDKSEGGAVDRVAVNIAKGVSSAKVSLRLYTALKQLLSIPAYLPETNLGHLAKSLATPWNAWNWCMENIPLFHKRWNSRMAGDPRLMKTEMDYKMWQTQVMQVATRIGMSPNAFIDALAVAIGAEAMYASKYKKYLKYGYPEEIADKKAKNDATVLFNQTQQSSESAFVSTMQVSRTWLNVMFSIFRNSSMAYTRQFYDAARNLLHYCKPGYAKTSREFMKKQFVRDGLTEEQAEKNASSERRRSILRDIARLGVFGFGLQFVWNLGNSLPYIIFGDDDDDKKKSVDDALKQAYFGSLEGLTGGDVMSSAGLMLANGNTDKMFTLEKNMPLASDIVTAFGHIKTDRIQATNDIVNLLAQSAIGVNPQTLTDAVVGIMDACNGDMDAEKECTMLILRIIQTPQSQLKKIYFDELRMSGEEVSRLTPSQIAQRYAQYTTLRNAPLTQWMYTSEGRNEVFGKNLESANDKAREAIYNSVSNGYIREKMEYLDKYEKAMKPINKLLKQQRYDEYDRQLDHIENEFNMDLIDATKAYRSDINQMMDWCIYSPDPKEVKDLIEEMRMRGREFMIETGNMK